jgi:putative molybdopterin biosynthesis protein
MGRPAYRRKIYLQDKPRQEALAEILTHFEPDRQVEMIDSTAALGRITAAPIFAHVSMPHYHASAMDGIAVVAGKTYAAHEQNPIQLKRNEDFIYVDTGHAVPSPFDAVIMIENVEEIDEDTLEIIEPASPWQHIRPIGEDIVQEEMLFPPGHTIRPVDIGALLAAKVLQVPVWKKPVVTIIPTGNELVQPHEQLAPGRLIEFNGSVFANYVTDWGGDPRLTGIVVDEPAQIREALLSATAESDIVVINAGSSAGSKDYTVHIIEELGEVFTHGVATRPGKPVILGKINGTIVVGVPGYPVSAYLALEWFVRPLICEYYHVVVPERLKLNVKLGRRIVSTMGAEDFIRMNIGYVDGVYVANPLTRAAGVTMSLVRADGLLVIPPDVSGLEQGEVVEVELLKPLREISEAIVFNGSHDLTIDLLSVQLRKLDPNRKVISSHVGSMAGLMAIKKGEAHVAGTHLLDPETGEYNITYVKRLLAGQSVVVYPFLKRMQGWFLPAGNPLGIQSVADIAELKADFVNRQKGAGTRVLFDKMLREANVTPGDIVGYQREMFSHLSVAAEVKTNERAVGLGIFPAAKAMDLTFIPVADEEYDLVMTKAFFESAQGRELIAVIQSEAFKAEVAKIGGYVVVENPEPVFVG